MAPWARIEPEQVGEQTLWFIWHSYGYLPSGDDQDGNGPFATRDEAEVAAGRIRENWRARHAANP